MLSLICVYVFHSHCSRDHFLQGDQGNFFFFFTVANKGINNTEMFLLCLLLFVAEQGLWKAKVFPAFHTAMLARKLGVPGRLGRGTAGTGGPNQPKEYSRQYDTILNI